MATAPTKQDFGFSPTAWTTDTRNMLKLTLYIKLLRTKPKQTSEVKQS